MARRLSTRETGEMIDGQRATEVAAVPADLSEQGLIGWVSLIRVTALDLQPDSPERVAFLALAVENLDFAAWLLRRSKVRAAYLTAEAKKLPDLASSVRA